MIKNNLYTYLGAMAAILVLATGIYLYNQDSSSKARSLTEREVFWEEKIESMGSKEAYAELADSMATLGPNQQHENAHIFGAALYEAKGESGLSTCDARFSFGCFHEFLGRAIASLGLNVVYGLNQKCVDELGTQALSCQHGIGHGVLAAIGYDDESMRKALEICKDLPYSDPIGGCYGGLFMEYNMQTMLGESGRTRQVTNGNLLHPCDTLTAEYAPACVFWITQWWFGLQHEMHGPDFTDFRAAGELCDRLKDRSLIRTCYEGIGNIVTVEVDFESTAAARACEEATPDKANQLYCKSFAANSIQTSGTPQKGKGTIVCDGLPARERMHCVAYAENRANIVEQLPNVEI